MTLVAAAIAPHGGIVIPELCAADRLQLAAATREGMEELSRRFDAARPEVIVVLTPHNLHVEDAFAVVVAGKAAGDIVEDGRRVDLSVQLDRSLALEFVAALREAELPAAAVSFGGNDPIEAVFPLDWGALIPLWFLGGRKDPALPAVVMSPCRDRSPEEHVRAGRALSLVIGGSQKRVALVASADHGHAHREDGPYGFDPAADEFDDLMTDRLAAGQLDKLEEIDPGLVDRAKADSWWQLLMLQGALPPDARWELLSYEAPTYFGMLTAYSAG